MSTKWNYDLDQNNILHFDIQRTEELINGFEDSKFGKSEGLDNLVGDKNVDLIVGGPPCQAYSMAGRVRDENGMQDDYRNFLFESYVKMVSHFQPKAFVFENVEGILSAKPGGISIVKRVRQAFEEIGYEITENLRENALFDTSFYNVPQKRKRVIIFGVQKNKTSKKQVRKFYSLMREKSSNEPLNSKIAFDNMVEIDNYKIDVFYAYNLSTASVKSYQSFGAGVYYNWHLFDIGYQIAFNNNQLGLSHQVGIQIFIN